MADGKGKTVPGDRANVRKSSEKQMSETTNFQTTFKDSTHFLNQVNVMFQNLL